VLEDEQVRAVIHEALQADAAARYADTLYAIGASVVADGLRRNAPFRFAGIGADGSLLVSNMTLEITPILAWATADYRWLTPEGELGASGRATFVLERLAGRWRIKHAHSSAVRPEESGRGAAPRDNFPDAPGSLRTDNLQYQIDNEPYSRQPKQSHEQRNRKPQQAKNHFEG
jgi:hypothetical protein